MWPSKNRLFSAGISRHQRIPAEVARRLHEIAQELGLRVAGVRSKHHLVFEILKFYSQHGTVMAAEGFLDYGGDHYGFLRWPDFSFSPNADDVSIGSALIRRHELRQGQKVKCRVRGPRDREKHLVVEEVLEVEGLPAGEWVPPMGFDDLKAMFPSERLILETPGSSAASTRVIDLVAPLGKGQRGLIVAPPRGGKTILLKNIAVSVRAKQSGSGIDRPSPRRATGGSHRLPRNGERVDLQLHFDESSNRHIEVADMVLNRAKRLVETGRDVVVLLDSLTRLARAHNSARQSGNGGNGGQHGGRVSSIRRVAEAAVEVVPSGAAGFRRRHSSVHAGSSVRPGTSTGWQSHDPGDLSDRDGQPDG